MNTVKTPTNKVPGTDFNKIRTEKIRKLESRENQKLLTILVYAPPLLQMWALLTGHWIRTFATANWKAVATVLIPGALVIGIVTVYLGPTLRRYAVTNRRAKIHGWLLQTAIMLVLGVALDNWWICGTLIVITTLAQIKRPTYAKLEDAIMLWEPDDKTSVYHDFAEARRAAGLL